MRPPANPDFSATALIEAMEEAGVNGSQLARQMGCSPTTVSQWRNGLTTPSDEMLERLADTLGVSTTELISDDEEFTSGWKGQGYRPYKGKPPVAREYDPSKDICRCEHPRSLHSERIPVACTQCGCRCFTSRQVVNRGRREEAFWDSVGQE